MSCPKLIWSLFASYFEVFGVKVQPLCLRRTEGANNHIKQDHTRLFTRDSVGVPYYQLAAMLTSAIHKLS